MLGREYALPFARAQYSVDATDKDRDALQAWRAAHPAHPSMNWDTVQPVMREEAHAAVQVALSRRPMEPVVSERLARRTRRTLWLVRAVSVCAGQADCASRASAVRRETARRYFLR